MNTAPTTRETADHAELARLAEAAVLCAKPDEEPWFEEWQFPHLDKAEREFIAAMSPAVCSALLSEIAALRGELAKTERDYTELRDSYDAVVAKLAIERDHGTKQSVRAAQAERQRDELRKALEFYAQPIWSIRGEFPEPSPHSEYRPDCGDTARQALANQGADQ